MCIVCRAAKAHGTHGVYVPELLAQEVMDTHEAAHKAMKDAAATMLKASKMFEPGYDKTHKRMVRIIREWAKLQGQRERDAEAYASPKQWEEAVKTLREEMGK